MMSDVFLEKYAQLIVTDGRKLIGKIICYDTDGNIVLNNVSEATPEIPASGSPFGSRMHRDRIFNMCMIPRDAIQSMDLVERAQTSGES